MQTARNLNRETYRHTVRKTQMEGISDREKNYQRETLTREIGRYLTHSKTLILTLLSLELQKWLCSQNWSEFNQKSISVSQKSLSCLRPMFASSRFCATMLSTSELFWPHLKIFLWFPDTEPQPQRCFFFTSLDLIRSVCLQHCIIPPSLISSTNLHFWIYLVRTPQTNWTSNPFNWTWSWWGQGLNFNSFCIIHEFGL